jgi:predicted acetylornithine/succinylornithine family transaminase
MGDVPQDQQTERRELNSMSTDWKALESKYYMHVVNRTPVVLVRGEGTTVWDDEGREYLDFSGGWAVNNVGHANPVVAEAVAEQARTLLQTSNQFYTIPQLQLAQVLVENSCLDRVFFSNSGAEANEGAIKVARKYGSMHRNGAYEIITADHSFHGRTLVTMAATGKPHDTFLPVPAGFVHVEFDNLDDIKSKTSDKTAAVMLEPVQGEGGVNIPSPGYFQGVREWCDENGLLLILDEVQTGLGRLGTLFGYEAIEVEPDVMTLAKGLGGGVPIGAFLCKEQVSVLAPGDHGSTFGGNALTCAAAYASTKYIIDNDVSDHARAMGEHLRRGLNDIKERNGFVKDVRGVGLLDAVEFNVDISAGVLDACRERGLLLVVPPAPNTIRLIPPLTTTEGEIDKGLEILEAGMVKAAQGS